MLKVKIYTIGRVKEFWLQEALADYEKRLRRTVEVEWALFKTDRELAEKIAPPWIALEGQGELIDSIQFSKKVMKLFAHHGSRLQFLIGGAEGIPQELLAKSVWRWSLSPLTFTHQMARLLLLEQLYRALEIESGTGYHK